MKTTSNLALALVAGALAVSGCGGDSSQETDRTAITEVVSGINTAVSEKDGAAYCEQLEPDTFLGASNPDAAFNSKNECTRETDQILKQAGDQPALKVEDISFDGDNAAQVSFAGRNGEASFVKVGDQWYLALGAVSGSSDSASGASGPTGATGGEGG